MPEDAAKTVLQAPGDGGASQPPSPQDIIRQASFIREVHTAPSDAEDKDKDKSKEQSPCQTRGGLPDQGDGAVDPINCYNSVLRPGTEASKKEPLDSLKGRLSSKVADVPGAVDNLAKAVEAASEGDHCIVPSSKEHLHVAGPYLQYLGYNQVQQIWRGSILIILPPPQLTFLAEGPTISLEDDGAAPWELAEFSVSYICLVWLFLCRHLCRKLYHQQIRALLVGFCRG